MSPRCHLRCGRWRNSAFRDIACPAPLGAKPFHFRRFTVYDFRQMKRRSYYPHAQIVSTMTVTSSTGAGLSRPTTPLTPSGENPPLPDNYEMKEKELSPQDEHDESYDANRSSTL